MLGRQIVFLVAVAALCSVPGCAQTNQSPAPSATATVSTTPTATASAGGTNANLSLPPEVPDGAVMDSKPEFVTPSGNIECAYVEGDGSYGVQCVLEEASFPSPRPNDCDTDWLATEINFVPPITTLGACRGDVPDALLNPNKPVLEYGTANETHGIRCMSEARGLSCWDPDSGHGFFVNRSVFAVY